MKFFNKQKFIKIICIFLVGLTIRYLINSYLDINVFTDYLDYISLTYFLFMSSFSVLINDLTLENLSDLFGNNKYMVTGSEGFTNNIDRKV